MFSKRLATIAGGMILIVLTIMLLTITSQHRSHSNILSRLAINCISPFQELVSSSIRTCQQIWKNYFSLVAVAYENERLRSALNKAYELNNRCLETQRSNQRLRALLDFKETNKAFQLVAAEVIGRDPSYWSKTMMIDKGETDGLQKGFPVVVHRGIVGQIIETTGHFSKVLLIIDQNSAVDSLLQRTRVRGIIKGDSAKSFFFEYVLRKGNVKIGDMVISSGLDGVYPKGLRVGTVSEILRSNSGIFQEIKVTPYVDFEKLEEVFVLFKPPHPAIQK
ncbi:MAG: rod shape-determining protein MreC [Candidatus Magnetoglobus multicellularis str. Araruama]|uniref:Cell shape-determining protein MreC n=1 Tax=Candidatus Magnetoglobus multicellularis str. Araruama TaxID=890399 RepID=A0A1V1P2J4_9BACT|nr:MAG: rod shape-determining protein MreC [Candidatus Magnetoglobus multicellularis str. Araruama]